MARLFTAFAVACAIGAPIAAQAPAQGAPQPPPPAKSSLPPIAAARAVAAQVKAAQAGETQGGKPAPTAEQPSAVQPAPAPSTVPPSGQPAPQQPPAYSYEPNGRRDPFVNLLARGSDVRPSGGVRPPGLPGLLIGELSVKGIVKDRGGFVAMLQASDAKTYIVHAGDHVLDGTVKSIVQDAVVFSQDVNDPLSLLKQREVRKSIRPEAK